MIKLAVFDLDGTLCDYGKGVLNEDLKLIKEIENSGVGIAICSGKPIYYLCGFSRQLGLNKPVLVGENGGSIQFGIDLPPAFFYHAPVPENAARSIAFFKEEIMTALPHLWCQPNEFEFSPFFSKRTEAEKIEKIIAENGDKIKGINIYRHPDCFDFIADNVNKGLGLKLVSEKLKLSPEQIVCVGNDENDYEMFKFSGTSIGINLKDNSKADFNFASLTEALRFIKGLC